MNAQSVSTTQSLRLLSAVAEADFGFSNNYAGLVAGFGFAAFLFASAPALAAPAPSLAGVVSFAILGGTAVTAAPPTSFINGDVGIAPTAATGITGFPANATITSPFVNHGNDATAIAARTATTALFSDPALAPAGGVAITANLSTDGPSANGHYTPGKYSLASGTAIIPTSITLDGAGVYVFSLNSDLTTSVGSTVVLNGADPCNVFWLVPTLATLNGVNFPGTVVAGTGVHLGTGATLFGRALAAAAGDVTMAGTNTVGGCSAPLAAPGGVALGKAFLPAIINTGGVSVLTITLSNNNAGVATLSAPLTDTLPPGVVIAPTPNASTTCGGGVVSTGVNTVSLSTGSTIPGGTPGTCTMTVNVTSTICGSFGNTLNVGALATNLVNGSPASNTVAASAILNATGSGCAPTSVPTLSEWAMVMLAALLAIAGFAAMLRRAK
jgi:hypothetical protein